MTHANTLSEPSPHEEQLGWERRWGAPAAAAAVASVLAQVGALVVSMSVASDAPDTNDSNEYLVFFRHFREHETEIFLSSLLTALGYALAAGAIYYLFQATRHRRDRLSPIFRWLLLMAPFFVIAAVIVDHTHRVGVIDDFFASGPETNNRAEDLLTDNTSALGAGLGSAGALALALSFVITSLNAMRAGLLTQFMGIVGIVAGALIVLGGLAGIGGLGVIQIFWMGALALLFFDRWPGGRGPAWATGQEEPWPRPDRRRLAAPPGDPPGEGGAEAEPEHEPMPERPPSRKRRKNRD